nr:hypothetical protein [Tanacetum cinerariifolium]
KNTASLLNTNQQQPEDFINPRNRQIAPPSMNMGQDRQMKMVGGSSKCNLESESLEYWKLEWANWPRRRDVTYLHTQLLIAQKEEGGIQLQAEEFDLMAAASDLDEIEEVNINCILMANLQQASTSDTQSNNALVYDSDGSAKVHNYENCDANEIFNMFTQEEQYFG